MPPKPSKTKNPSKSGKASRKTQKSASSRENKYESTTCDAVLRTELKIGDNEEMKEEAKDALGQELQEKDFYNKALRGEHFVGGHCNHFLDGLAAEVWAVKIEMALYKDEISQCLKKHEDELASHKEEFASQKDEFSRRLKKHEDEIASQKEEIVSQKDEFSRHLRKHEDEIASQNEKIASHKEEIASQKAEVTRLRKDVYRLQVSSTKYMQLRDRYISTFKRDKLGPSNRTGKKIIKKGNNVFSHGPNAITDAALYTLLNQRSDIDPFEKLYGLNPAQVSGLHHSQTIIALNIHAGMISSKDKVGSEKFYKLFAEFIKLLNSVRNGAVRPSCLFVNLPDK
ncbi:hypothetical protein B9Z19DRAFT_1128236 [Tuber borchii]|uniref:Uncharacterized protein n=1 Tax=Tuber borchii TaxID=42251 RepID=A0A2T6ZPU4_TUBBO|nr:hypothetical protein B9Z19DRAFT_1128236 [Tuber borchii]